MRTSAKRSFTRLNNIVCQSMSQDNDLDLIEERFEELKKAWKKVEELHDQYVSMKEEEPEDEVWLDEIFETFSKTQERFFMYRKANKKEEKFKIKLKPVELPRFAGSIRDYPRFKKDFQRQVLPHTSPESAAFTLRQCLSREVQENVSLVDDDVDQMLQKLEEEYGDPSLMTDLIVSEIKSYEVQGKKERLMKFIDIVEKGYYDLNNLGLDRELSNTIVVGIIETKLPEGTRQKWVDRVCSDDSKVDMRNKFPSLLKFLQEVRRSLKYMSTELREPPKACIPSMSQPSPSTPSTESRSTTSVLNSNRVLIRQNARWSCQACGQGRHGLAKCSQYQRMTVEDRWDVARKAGVCFQCLGPHLARQCTSKTCPTCHQPHHSSLHRRPPAAVSPTGPVASYQPGNQRFGSGSSGQPDPRPPSHHRGQEDHLRASDNRDNQHHQTHQLNPPQPQAPNLQPAPLRQRYTATRHRFRCFSQTAVLVATGPRAHSSCHKETAPANQTTEPETVPAGRPLTELNAPRPADQTTKAAGHTPCGWFTDHPMNPNQHQKQRVGLHHPSPHIRRRRALGSSSGEKGAVTTCGEAPSCPALHHSPDDRRYNWPRHGPDIRAQSRQHAEPFYTRRHDAMHPGSTEVT